MIGPLLGWWAWPRWALMAALASIAAMVAVVVGSGDDGPVLCPYRRCTGGYCPGCGLTRATGSLLRGDLGASWRAHPFAAIVAIEAVAIWAWFAGSRWRRGRPPARLVALDHPVDTILTINAVVLLVVWAGRLATGTIPGPFGP